MPDTIEQRVSRLEIDSASARAISQEQYAQIMQQLASISGQLQAFNSTFVRRDLCEQAHKAYDREQYEFRHTIEKRIVESDAILAGEIQKIETRLKADIDGIGRKLTSWTNRIWAIFLPVITGILVLMVMSHIGGAK